MKSSYIVIFYIIAYILGLSKISRKQQEILVVIETEEDFKRMIIAPFSDCFHAFTHTEEQL